MKPLFQIIILISGLAIALFPLILSDDKLTSRNIKYFSICIFLTIFASQIFLVVIEQFTSKKNQAREEDRKKVAQEQIEEIRSLKTENSALRSEIKSLEVLLKKQSSNVSLGAELDNKVWRLNIYIYLDDTYEFEEIHPASFAYSLSGKGNERYGTNLSIREVLVTDSNFRSDDKLLVSFKTFQVTENGTSQSSPQLGSFKSSLLFFRASKIVTTEEINLRNLDGAILGILVDPKLVEKVTRIVLTADDKWILLDKSMNRNDWEKLEDIRKHGYWNNYDLEQKTFYRPKDSGFDSTINRNPWAIDLFDGSAWKFIDQRK